MGTSIVQWKDFMKSLSNLIILSALLVNGGLGKLALGQERGKIAPPVDTEKSFERSTFQADEHQVYTLLLKILTDHGFDFLIKDKNLGRIETTYVVFSRNPEFSKLSNGVKSLAKTPRLFLKKWLDGRIKIVAEVRRLSQNNTEVVLRPDIYGFASTLTDDTGVTGEWRQCTSNGKFEFELFNELATRLRKEGLMNPPEVTEVQATPAQEPTVFPPDHSSRSQGSSNLVLNSVPEGAEILLDNVLVGMTPSRLTIAAGPHQVIFRKQGFKDYQRQFTALKDSDLTLLAEMERK
jgi:PEGA domain-containing protein